MECVTSDTVAVLSHHSVSDVKYTGYEFPKSIGFDDTDIVAVMSQI